LDVATCQEELTSDWLAHVLGCEPTDITNLEIESEEADAGFVSLICFITLEFNGASNLPTKLVAKFAPTFESAKEIVQKYGTFQRECDFYSKIAPRLPVRCPELHFGHHDQDTGLGVLLLEDCSSYRTLSQTDEQPTTLEELEHLVRTAARMHAASWEAPWLDEIDTIMAPGQSHWSAYFQDIQDGWSAFLSDASSEMVPAVRPVAERLAESMMPLTHEAMPRDKCCLTHLDYRLDNIFYDDSSDDPAVLFDWQSMYKGRGAHDIGYLLATGYSPEFRREHERDLMQVYHDELLANGVAGYSDEEAWEDYLHGILIGLRLLPMFVDTLDMSSDRAQALANKIVVGLGTAAVDHGGTELIDRVLSRATNVRA
jgi:hypothetical protein